MIIVTGGAGFIGSNLIKALNDRGESDILVVDNLNNGHKFANLADLDVADYLDKEDFLAHIEASVGFGDIRAIYHQGACSTTTEWDGRYMMANNYEYSKALLHYSMEHNIPFLYASSAAVYGGSETFKEERQFEVPLNVYGYSKFQFDQYVRRYTKDAPNQIVGFRYFNVYGPREQHKGGMASVAYHLNNQLKEGDTCRLFAGYDGYGDGEQKRDFVYVKDVVDVNLWFMDNDGPSGIYNLGSGRSQTFNDVANAVIKHHNRGQIEYIPFPDKLKGAYQSFTEADISKLRDAGYDKKFHSVEEGVADYMKIINS